MLKVMSYMYNNIENLNKCNHSTNKYSGNISCDNNQITYLAGFCVEMKMELSKQLCQFLLC